MNRETHKVADDLREEIEKAEKHLKVINESMTRHRKGLELDTNNGGLLLDGKFYSYDEFMLIYKMKIEKFIADKQKEYEDLGIMLKPF